MAIKRKIVKWKVWWRLEYFGAKEIGEGREKIVIEILQPVVLLKKKYLPNVA